MKSEAIASAKESMALAKESWKSRHIALK